MNDRRTGALRHRLSLQALSRVSDGGGGFTESWEEVTQLWAAIRPVSGDEAPRAGRLEGRLSHVITLRYRDGVSPAMRFAHGLRVFEILSVVDVEERKTWLHCLCEEKAL
ncbi:phage head closure protein [Methyloligella sp. 2.7D]|uniref:phage head closure protein n=1 Tax=unclassified Methyloligella TaxID=2625955 RepID=UPI00157E0A61|nr:phage head closure protein [Methyloligella sp. GL2]QKP77113.1 phage head closure protein [Methyloligella sp. GL2]